jgi:hypothetical protein
MYVCMYIWSAPTIWSVCMYVCMYVWWMYDPYVCTYACMYVCIYDLHQQYDPYVCMYVCMYIWWMYDLYVCTYACMYVCIYDLHKQYRARTHAQGICIQAYAHLLYIYIYIHTYIHACIFAWPWKLWACQWIPQKNKSQHIYHMCTWIYIFVIVVAMIWWT